MKKSGTKKAAVAPLRAQQSKKQKVGKKVATNPAPVEDSDTSDSYPDVDGMNFAITCTYKFCMPNERGVRIQS